MKRILYCMPAAMIVLFYGMLSLLAGGISGFQLRAWLMILLPLVSAVLLVKGKWWGSVPGMTLGSLILILGFAGSNTFMILVGTVVVVYYLVMGILCLKDTRRK